MIIILTNKTKNAQISVVDRNKSCVHDLLPGDSCRIIVSSDEEIKDYRRSYEGFGIAISKLEKPAEEPKVEEAKPETPKRSRRKKEETPLPSEEVSREELKADSDKE